MNLRNIFLLITLSLNTSILNAQYPMPSDTATLAINNMVVKLINSGSFLNYASHQKPPFLIKTANGKLPLANAMSLWFGANSTNNKKKVAVGLYPENGKDFFPGGLADNGLLDTIHSENFNRFWSITATDIGLLIADFEDNQIIDYKIPYNVRAWPAKGNPFFESANGFPLPEDLIGAPFVDTNGDGIYNPIAGDYPCIAGDKAYWWVFNDAGQRPNDDALHIEVQAIATASSSQGGIMDNTLFFDFTFRNRSTENIDSTFISLITDLGYGNTSNNKIASLPAEDIAFFYNAPPYHSTSYFEENIGVLAIKTIKAPVSPTSLVNPMSSFIFYKRSGTSTSIGSLFPRTPLQYYNYMNGFWRDGYPLQLGGDGYLEPNAAITKYAFNPSGDLPWHDLISTVHLPIINHKTFQLNTDESNRITYAVSWIEGEFDINNESHKQRIIDSMNQTLFYFMDGENQLSPNRCHYILPDEDVTSPIFPDKYIKISPNPTKDEIYIELQNKFHTINSIDLLDMQGKKISGWDKINKNYFNISRNGQLSGMYVLKIKLSTGEEVSKKVVFE